MTQPSYTFSSQHLFHETAVGLTTHYRDFMYEKFRRHITLLLEQKKSRKVPSRKGLLNPRHLHRYQYSDNIFEKTIRTATTDTTIVFLIDGSGSMDAKVSTPLGTEISAMRMCGAVASAFAKANATVLKNRLPLEVFVKSAPPVESLDATGTNNGGMVTLTRVFSSNAKKQDYNRLCTLRPYSPLVSSEGRLVGSFTSEYAVLPALSKWMKKNIRTKQCIVFNLTDGETYCLIGNQYQFRNRDTKAMRMKYLRGIPNVTLMIDSNYGYGGSNMESLRDTYGDNMLLASEDFTGALFRVFAGFLN